MKRILSLIAVMVMVAVMFCGCGGKGDSSDVSNTADGSVINFAEQGFSIVRPENNKNLHSFATKIMKAVNEGTGKSIKITDDTYEENAKGEILLGLTNREESIKVFDTLVENGAGHESEYVIAFIDGKIAINAYTQDGLEAAVEKFIADYCKTGEIKNNEAFVNKYSGANEGIYLNGKRAGCFRIIVPNYNHSYLVTRKINELCAAIKEQNGYEPQVVTDEKPSLTDYEIVIGDCDREGVKTIAEHENYDITNNGKTIFINGGRNYSIAYAVDLFLQQVKGGGTVMVENKSGGYDNSLDYRLVWTDEFDTFDNDVWTTENEVQNYYGKWYGMGTARSDTAENLGVKDGKMYHTATYDTDNFYGTYATTKNSVNFTYGYMEISSSLADGDGIWHCFWIWADRKDHLEFDIMECWSGAHYYGNHIHEFVNGDQYSINGEGEDDPHMFVKRDEVLDHGAFWNGPHKDYSTNMHDQMHTFGCEWTETELNYTRDGEVTMNYVYEGTENEFLYDQPHYFILSMLVGSNYDNLPDDAYPWGVKRPVLGAEYWSNGRNTWTIDYLQLFQKEGSYIDLRG